MQRYVLSSICASLNIQTYVLSLLYHKDMKSKSKPKENMWEIVAELKKTLSLGKCLSSKVLFTLQLTNGCKYKTLPGWAAMPFL